MLKTTGRPGPRSGFNPQTASTPAMQSRPPVQTKIGATAQRQINQPPQPFANPMGPTNVPTGRLRGDQQGIEYTKPSPVNARPQNYGSAVMSDAEMRAALGEPEPSGRGVNSINSGHPTRNTARRSGPAGAQTTRRRQ